MAIAGAAGSLSTMWVMPTLYAEGRAWWLSLEDAVEVVWLDALWPPPC
ncbi:MAG TPA: hypothetical protein VE127_08985 [Solirubrobacteraceae bacterium]|nr:hypothetical protein [Solirubrobacteraceae bacterium]